MPDRREDLLTARPHLTRRDEDAAALPRRAPAQEARRTGRSPGSPRQTSPSPAGPGRRRGSSPVRRAAARFARVIGRANADPSA
jgi:hypothetical protein